MQKKEVVNMKDNKSFKGIWIDKSILENERLSLSEKVLLAMIDVLTRNRSNESTASNKYLAKKLNITTRRVQQILSNLKTKGFISSRIKFQEGTKEVSYRAVKITSLLSRNSLHPNNAN